MNPYGYPNQQPDSNYGYPQQQPGGQQPYTSQYPPQQPMYPGQPGYPSQSQPGYPSQPQPGYPPQSQPGYPPQPQPGYPPQSQSGYPPQPQTCYPPQPNTGYPAQPGYPPQTQSNAVQQQFYSGQQSVPQQSSYPPQQPGYPQQMPQTGGYPTQSYVAPNTTSPTYPPQGQPQMYPNMPGGPPNMGYGATPAAASFMPKGNPTVKEAVGFNPVEDAKLLRKAMKGFGTDEDGLINVLCRRTNSQRMAIAQAFKTSFGKDLIEDIKSETSGKFETLLVTLLTPTLDFYVSELHEAISGVGTDEDVLIEVLCGLSNHEIYLIKECYERTHHKSLEAELMQDTSGNFKRLLVSLCNASRDESGVVNIEAARKDASDLLNAGELRIGTDESTFNFIFCQRNFEQLKLIFSEYEKLRGHSISRAIEKEFSGDIQEGLLAIVQCVIDKPGFFAARLKKSMAGFGTNDRQLIRLVATRSEIDMQDIKQAFQAKFGDSLRNWLKGDTSGHYKHALYVLIGETKS